MNAFTAADPGDLLKIHTDGETPRTVLLLARIENEQEWIVVACAETSESGATELCPTDLESGELAAPLFLKPHRCFARTPAYAFTKVGQLKTSKLALVLRDWNRHATVGYYEAIHRPEQELTFTPGQTRIPYAGRIFDSRDMVSLVDSALDFWLTSGRQVERFEKKFAEFFGLPYALLVNSGSSANLLALSALTSPSLGEARLRRGDEVITVAAGFPTTVTPILQFGAVPVFVDIELPTYNIDVSKLEAARSSRTKAVMIAHTLGNPFDLQAVKDFCDRNKLWLIEDNCDALGSRYLYNGEWKLTGTIGDLATSSFYPPHHMTMGEGGAVYTRNAKLKRAAESFRDWGRDCWCPAGQDNTCKKRFNWKLGELPAGYDHKYIYSHLGYNLKATDMQGAIGCTQLEKVPSFISARRKNWAYLRNRLAPLEKYFVMPEATANAEPSWFGFLLSLRPDAPFERKDLIAHLESRRIQTRMLFAGNLLRHPAFDEMRAAGSGYRVVGSLTNTDYVMERGFWFGVYPGLSTEKLDYICESVEGFVRAV